MSIAFLVLGGILAAGAPQEGQTSGIFKACMDRSGGVTVDMRACISEEHERQDEMLNRTYRELMQLLGSEGRTDLQNAQRAWIAFREAECAYRASGETGTLGPVIIDTCWLDFTAERVAVLKRELDRVIEWGPLN